MVFGGALMPIRAEDDTGAATAIRAGGDRRGVTAICAGAVNVRGSGSAGGGIIEIPSAAVETTVSSVAYAPSHRRVRRDVFVGTAVGGEGGYMSRPMKITVLPLPVIFPVWFGRASSSMMERSHLVDVR